MYKKEYARRSETIMLEGFEYPVPLPKKPPIEQFRNYGKPEKDQKFQIDPVPRDIYQADEITYRNFCDEQWHKRINGDWWLIKGKEVYISGTAWFFFNCWETQGGGLPQFRMEAVEWFLVWDFILNDPNCLGMLDFKCRRVGDTEKALCAGYELKTRYRKSNFGMQNRIEDEAEENFKRITEAHSRMPKWFKPVHRGLERPENEIDFRYPSEQITAKSIRSGKQDRELAEYLKVDTPELGGKIDYMATKEKAYDGQRLIYYHLDEVGKISPKQMDARVQWGVIKKCLSLYNEVEIVGKGMFTSTIEHDERDTGKDVTTTVAVCRQLWDGSNPNDRTETGRTTTGLYRYFRGYKHAARVDEWGFHKIEEAKQMRDAQIAAYVKAKDWTGLAQYKRQLPEDIEESLAIPVNECVLYPALLDMQQQRIKDWQNQNRMLLPGQKPFPQAVQGDFVWTNGFKSKVAFVPNENGRFSVSGHPDIPNNKFVQDGRLHPGNKGVFSMGLDPVDHKGAVGSDFSISVFRNWDPSAEKDLIWDHSGEFPEITNKWAMKTRRFVCIYSRRPNHPDEAYEDALKCAMYYGIPIYLERQKPGMLRYLEYHKMDAYKAWKPTWVKVGAKKEADAGTHNSMEFASLWQDELKRHVYEFIETYVHPFQLRVFRNFTGENATECDQVVSSGFALVDSKQYLINLNREAERENNGAERFPFAIYNN